MIAGIVASQFVTSAPPPPPPEGGDPDFASVKLLLHGDGTNGSTTLTDSSSAARTVTAFNQTQISTARSKFGGASILMDGAADYATAPASVDWNFGSGDFTVEAWVYMAGSASANYRPIVCQDNIAVTRGWLFLVDKDNAGKLNFTGWSSNAANKVVLSASAFPQNVWKHVAASRFGNSLRLFIDGALDATVDVTGLVIQNPAQPLVVGKLWSNSAVSPGLAENWAGNIDDLRITKGVGRYTATFTPPTAAHPNN